VLTGVYGTMGRELNNIKVGIVNQDKVCLECLKDFLATDSCNLKNLSYKFLNLMRGDQFDDVSIIKN
jgi:hypothetical protein